MFGIPYEKVIIQSKLEPPEIVDRLKAVTSRFLWYKWPPKDKDFVGTISLDGFRIHRNIRNRNTYLPLLVGKIYVHNEGSEIVVTMSLHPIAILLLLGLFSYFFYGLFIPDGEAGAILLFCSVAFVFHLVMYLMGFCPEVSRAKERLQEILADK
jgi:hypothetical protein